MYRCIITVKPKHHGSNTIHIISAYPYDRRSWAAYNFRGEAAELEVLE